MTTNSRYSQHARRALAHARSLARDHAHVVVDSTHLLIGILKEDGSIGCHILRDLQMDLRHTERAFMQLPHEKGNTTLPALTNALQDALLLANDESRWLGQHYVGTEHFLLGLARSN